MIVTEITGDNASSVAEDVARIHADAYSREHFSATFGFDKLREYNLLLIENSDISLVAMDGVHAVGFVISGTGVSRGVSEFTRRNRAFLIRTLLCHPVFLLDKISGKLKAVFSRPAPSAARYRLLSIATDPKAQSKGVGAALLAALEQRLRERGVPRYGLSVRKGNPRAVEFYRRNGFTQEKEQTGSLYFVKELN